MFRPLRLRSSADPPAQEIESPAIMSHLFETDLSGKTVAITGASRGVGAETAALFAQSGAKVALLARSGADLKNVADSIGEGARAYPCDLGEIGKIAPLFDEIKAELGYIDILINNGALIAPIARMGEADLQAWDNLMRVNVTGLFATTQACLPDMVARGVGTVINISSGAAKNAYEGWSAYCASKAAVAMLTQSLDLEYRDAGIRALGLSPGTVATQMQRDIRASGMNPVSQIDWADHIAPHWVARALLWMTTSEADGHLGQDISLRDPALRSKLGLV